MLVIALTPADKEAISDVNTLKLTSPFSIDCCVLSTKSVNASEAILEKPGIVPSTCKNWLAGPIFFNASSLSTF